MKYCIALFMLLGIVLTSSAFSADNVKKLPSVKVKNLKGESINTSTFSNDGKPIVISFWATWCKPCLLELTTINEKYADWQKETGVKLIAISIDDTRNSSKVKPLINSRSWDYEVYLDENSDFKRAMSVNDVPHTFVVNAKGEIVWQHASYAQGDEEELHTILKKVTAGEEIK